MMEASEALFRELEVVRPTLSARAKHDIKQICDNIENFSRNAREHRDLVSALKLIRDVLST